MIDAAEKRGQIVRHLELALAIADDVNSKADGLSELRQVIADMTRADDVETRRRLQRLEIGRYFDRVADGRRVSPGERRLTIRSMEAGSILPF